MFSICEKLLTILSIEKQKNIYHSCGHKKCHKECFGIDGFSKFKYYGTFNNNVI